MNGRANYRPANEHLNRPAKTLKSSFMAQDNDRKAVQTRGGQRVADQNKPWEKAAIPPLYMQKRMPMGGGGKQQERVELRNAEKLLHFQQLQASNIDDLNSKIQRMISKLAEEVSPAASIISQQAGSKARVKTEYTDYCHSNYPFADFTEQVDDSHDLRGTTESFFLGGRGLMESEVIKQSIIIPDKRTNDHRQQQAEAIRKKYKIAPKQRTMNHDRSMSALSNGSTTLESFNSHIDADLIRFRQKLKGRQRRQASNLDLSLEASSIEKPTLTKAKRNLEEELSKYEKRLNSYNSKKLICLAGEGQIERLPLVDRTNTSNHYFKYSPFVPNPQSNHQQYKQEEAAYGSFEEEQTEEPLTADFRQPSDKNQLKLLLKNLSAQISLDEQFRNGKKWFERVGDSHKWNDLSREVERSELDLDETSIREIFCLREEQENPFFTPRDEQYGYHQLVQLFIRCEEHWFENIVKKYNRERLLASGFRESKLDIGGKGHIAIEDLVRFLNLQMELGVRNRDLLMIFQRLRSEDHLSFPEVLEVVCQ